MATAKKKAAASKEISSEAHTEAQESIKSSLPSLPHQFSEESLLGMFESAQREAKSEVPDVETEEGRKNIKDLARKVSASNKAIDTPMRDYLRVLKTQPKALEKNARESKARFDELKASILKPLADAQAGQDAIIEWLTNVPVNCSAPGITSEELISFIDISNGYNVDLVWPELRKKFKVAHEAAVTTASVTLDRVSEAEKQAERLAELEDQAAKQKQIDHDRVVAENAAKKAQQDAEEKAQRDRVDVERRAAEAKQREESAVAEKARAIRDAELAEKRRLQEVADAKVREEKAKIDADLAAKKAAEQAREAEAKRIADEEKAQAKLAKDRESDKAHTIAVNRANLVVLIAAGFSEDDSKKFIRMVAKNELPDIKIHY